MVSFSANYGEDLIMIVGDLHETIALFIAVVVVLVSWYVKVGASKRTNTHFFSTCEGRRREDNDDATRDCDEYCPKRIARYWKCAKRSARRRSQQRGPNEAQDDSDNWQCPFDCSFARIRMPAPLPFRRKKRSSLAKSKSISCEANFQETDVPLLQENSETLSEEDLTEASNASFESQFWTEAEAEVTPSKSERQHRHKRRTAIYISSHASVPALPVTITTLIDLAMMQNWDQLLVNLKANKREARRRDADGLYPLHWAVSGGPPLEVVHALVKAYPGAAKKVDSEGSNALHFACHYGGSAEMMDVLLEANPKGIRVQDKYGRSPLYHAVDKSANIQVLKTLAMSDPEMITVSCQPKNYQQLEKEGKRWDYLTPLYLAWVNFLTDKRSVETCSGKIWEKACLLLKLAYCHQLGLALDTEVPLMPAMVTLDPLIPEELAAVVIGRVSPQDLLECDPISGKNALALVASLDRCSPERTDELIRLLLDACPDAAIALDKEGKTALANAAESGKSWDTGLERLFRAYPDALVMSDKTTGLAPSLLLAASSPRLIDPNQRTNVLLADPYILIGVKSLSSMKHMALERRRKSRENSSPFSARDKDTRNEHLSSLFQMMIEDPSCIVAAVH